MVYEGRSFYFTTYHFARDVVGSFALVSTLILLYVFVESFVFNSSLDERHLSRFVATGLKYCANANWIVALGALLAYTGFTYVAGTVAYQMGYRVFELLERRFVRFAKWSSYHLLGKRMTDLDERWARILGERRYAPETSSFDYDSEVSMKDIESLNRERERVRRLTGQLSRIFTVSNPIGYLHVARQATFLALSRQFIVLGILTCWAFLLLHRSLPWLAIFALGFALPLGISGVGLVLVCRLSEVFCNQELDFFYSSERLFFDELAGREKRLPTAESNGSLKVELEAGG